MAATVEPTVSVMYIWVNCLCICVSYYQDPDTRVNIMSEARLHKGILMQPFPIRDSIGGNNSK